MTYRCPFAVLLVIAFASTGCALSSRPDASIDDAPGSGADVREPLDAGRTDGPVAYDAPDPLEDAPVGYDAPDAPPDPPPGPHLLVLYWPFALADWSATRTATGFEMGGALVALPTGDMVLLTGLAAAPPLPVEDTHADIPPTLWTGAADRVGDHREALHPSLDALVARRFGEEPMFMRGVTRGYDTYAPPMSWIDARVPSPLIGDVDAAAALAPCSTTRLPAMLDGPHTFEEMTAVASAQLQLVAESFRGGCRHTAALELGGYQTQFGGHRIFEIMHDDWGGTPGAAAVTDALARWLAAELFELASSGVLDDTVVVLTTQIGGTTPLAHDFSALPVFLWSRAPSFRPGWIASERRPVRDWLHTVGLAFDVDAPFSAEGQPGGVPIAGIWSP